MKDIINDGIVTRQKVSTFDSRTFRQSWAFDKVAFDNVVFDKVTFDMFFWEFSKLANHRRAMSRKRTTAGQFGAQFVHEISPWCGVVVN